MSYNIPRTLNCCLSLCLLDKCILGAQRFQLEAAFSTFLNRENLAGKFGMPILLSLTSMDTSNGVGCVLGYLERRET